MAGETTVIHLPFAGGMDENIAKEYLDASSRQASVLNGDFVKVGVIDKRSGVEHLETTLIAGGELPAMTTGTRVVGWSRSSLSILCSTGLYQYVEAPVGGAAAAGVVGVGKVPDVAVVRRPLVAGDQEAPPILCDFAQSGALLRVSVFWDSEYNVLASVYDVASGNVVLEPTRIYENTGTIGAGSIPVAFTAFDAGLTSGVPNVLVFVRDNIDGSVSYVKYTTSTNSFGSPVVVVASNSHSVDVAPYEDDPAGGWLVLYDVGGSLGVFGDTMRLAYWTSAGIQTYVDQAIRIGDTLKRGAYVCARYGQSVWAIWTTTLGGSSYYWAQRRIANTAFATASVPLAFDNRTGTDRSPFGAVHLGADKIFVSYEYSSASTAPGPVAPAPAWRVLSHSAGTVSSWAFGRCSLGLLPATRPFVVGGEVFQTFYYDLKGSESGPDVPSQQVTFYLCKFEGVSNGMSSGTIATDVCRPVATVAPRFSVSGSRYFTLCDDHVPHPSSVDRDATRVAAGLKTGGQSGPAWAVDFLFDADSRGGLYQPSELGSELSLSGGVPFVADGRIVFEDGFFNFPEFTYVTTTGAACPLDTGDYTFAVVYRSVDSAGLTHRSAPFICDPVSVTSGGAGPLLQITPPLASYRDALAESGTSGAIWADVYMTTANGSTLYYKGSVVASNDASYGVVVFYPEGGITYVDAEPDTTSPLLYTTGGVMDNVNPPASSIQITHQKRKALVDETLRAVWLSKQFSSGEAPGFNETLYVEFPEGGDITALGSLDGKFIAFKARSIWVMVGEGPAVTGQGSSWTSPESIPTDVGCKSWRSVVSTPRGLLFQAPNNGIYLLGRDLQVTFVGKNVIDRTAAYPNVVSAVLVPASSQVRFVCLNEDGDDHLVIVYDYEMDTWATHQYARMSDVPAAACLSNDSTPRYTVLTADGKLWQERLSSDAARYMDQDEDGTDYFVPTVVTVPYVKLQVQGYHKARRVQFFGEQQDDCGLQIEMAFNYDDIVRQTATWSPAQLRSLNVRGQVESYVGSAYSKQMSMQLTISDTEGTAMTTGAGMRFVSTAVELQNLGPRYRLLSAGARR